MRREDRLERRRKRLTALHEAGHIVVALVQGHADQVSRLRFNQDCSRGIDRRGGQVSVRRLMRRDFLIRLLAGGEAERQLSHASVDEMWDGTAVGDREAAVEALRESHHDLLLVAPALGGAYVAEEFEEARQAARQLLVRHWSAVEAVAELLVDLATPHEHLEGARAVTVALGADELLAALPQFEEERRGRAAPRLG